MMGTRATLSVAGKRALGWLTDHHPDAPGEVVLVLDANLARAFWPGDLAPDDPLPHASRN